MRKLYACIAIVIATFAIGAAPCAQAQTCRVKCGVSSDGVYTYKEVYEYDFVTVKPEYPGGDCELFNFVSRTRQYPKKAYQKGIEGRVTCSFVVNADGKISNVEVFKGVEASLNAEAVRVLSKMCNWHPGSIDGKAVPVRVLYTIPFRK